MMPTDTTRKMDPLLPANTVKYNCNFSPILDFYLGTRKPKNSNFCSRYQKTFRSFFNIQNFRLF